MADELVHKVSFHTERGLMSVDTPFGRQEACEMAARLLTPDSGWGAVTKVEIVATGEPLVRLTAAEQELVILATELEIED